MSATTATTMTMAGNATNPLDQAALAAANGTHPGANAEAMKQAFYDRCREWGEKKGAGSVSKVGMILDTAKTAWDLLIVPSKVSEGSDAAKAYDGWRAGQKAKAGNKRFSGDDSSRKNRISEINRYIRVGGLPLIRDTDMGGYGVLKRAVRIIEDNDDIKGETEDLLSKVATRQLATPQVPLADDEIVAACEPKSKKQETYVDAMGRVRQQLDSIGDKFPSSANRHLNEHKTARAVVQKIIDDEGGTAAEIRRREEAARKAFFSGASRKKRAKKK